MDRERENRTVLARILQMGGIGLIFGLAPHMQLAFGHQNHQHSVAPRTKGQQHTPPPEARDGAGRAILQIQRSYQAKIQPIFEKKCLQCHGGNPMLPWYYSLPGVRQLMDRDLQESKEHLDFSKGYPFISHASPTEDMDAIRESVEKGTMPPFLYRLAHPWHRLTQKEVRTVVDWTNESVPLIKRGGSSRYVSDVLSFHVSCRFLLGFVF